MSEFSALLRRAIGGEDLSQDEAAAFIGEVMDGNYTPAQAGALLAALAAKGESVDEIVGAARAMRERSLHVEHGLPMVIDVVGTGGDHADTINISTMAALVVASCGHPGRQTWQPRRVERVRQRRRLGGRRVSARHSA